MLECEFGTFSGDGTEGEGRRGVAGVVSDSFALVGFLSVLEAVVHRMVESEYRESVVILDSCRKTFSRIKVSRSLTCAVSMESGHEERRLLYSVCLHDIC